MQISDSCVAPLIENELRGEVVVPPTDGRIAVRYSRQLRDVVRPLRNRLLRGLPSLLRCSLSVAHTEIPAILVSNASRELVSHSLTGDAFQSITNDKLALVPAPVPPDRDVKPSTRTIPAAAPLGESAVPLWLTPLQDAFKGDNRARVRQSLRVLAKDEAANGFARCMADFGDSLLGSTGRSRTHRSPSSAKDLVLLFARRIGSFFNGDDPAGYESSVLDSVYLQAIEGAAAYPASRAIKGEFVRALLEFDLYLAAVYGKDPINKDEMPWAADGLDRVDASLITFEQYATVLVLIDRTWPCTEAKERRKIARLLVILGFRCGLRRREALCIRMRDLSLDGVCEMLIRPSKTHRLKSPNAKRRLPLDVFLTGSELSELQDWIGERRRQGAQMDDCVFGNALENLKTVPPTIFTQINRCLSDVTGNPKAHFHQCRHAFASWLFLALMLSDLDPVQDLFPHLHQTTEWLAQAHSLRERLYLNAQHTRRHAYMLAQLLGHGNPDTSMANYVHFLDWLLAIHLRQSRRMRPALKLVEAASNTPRSTLQRWEQGDGEMSIPIHLAHKKLGIPHRALEPIPEQDSKRRNDPVCISTLQARMESAWNYLFEVETSKRPEEEIQQRHDIVDPDGLIERVKYLRSLTLTGGKPRHRMESWGPEGRNASIGRALACPRKPVHENRKINSELLDSVARVLVSHPQLCVQAVSIFVHFVQEDGFVRFDQLGNAPEANTYFQFLTAIGIQKQHIRFVSGDRSARSPFRAQWIKELRLNSRSPIEKPPSKTHFGPASALSIRTRFLQANGTEGGDSGLRFMFVMLFILFGQAPSQ
jgi:integrase